MYNQKNCFATRVCYSNVGSKDVD